MFDVNVITVVPFRMCITVDNNQNGLSRTIYIIIKSVIVVVVLLIMLKVA